MPRKTGDVASGGDGNFTVDKGVLRAGCDLYWEYLEEFDAACDKLLTSKRSLLEVDLTAVNFISSSFLGCLNNLLLRAGRMKKRILLRIGQDILWLFEVIGLRDNMELEVH